MKKYIILALSVFCLSVTQIAFSATTTAEIKNSTTSDELCVLSNGNTIPCIWKDDAENSIKNADVKPAPPTVNGETLCSYSNGKSSNTRTYVAPCKYVVDGNAVWYWVLLSYSKEAVEVLGVLLVLGIIVMAYKKVKKLN
jgi:hypothetical protein